MNTADELAKLAQLRDQGVLTEEEFQRQKEAVLAADQPVKSPPAKKVGVGRGCLVIIVVLVVLGIIGAIAGSKGGDTSSTNTTVAAIPVTATQLFEAYHDNEPAAQERYGNSPLLVTGEVDSIDLDFKGDSIVKLKTPNEFMSAQAELADSAKSKASSIIKGSSITLRCGKVMMVIGSPMLSDCDIQ